jgi:hypothetical protein
MSNIPQFLLCKEIKDTVKNLINIGYDSYNQLLEFDKEKLTSKIIKILGTDSYNLIIDNDDFGKLLNHFSNFLISDSLNDAFKIAKTMRKNALEYYKDNLNDLFEYLKEDEMRISL